MTMTTIPFLDALTMADATNWDTDTSAAAYMAMSESMSPLEPFRTVLERSVVADDVRESYPEMSIKEAVGHAIDTIGPDQVEYIDELSYRSFMRVLTDERFISGNVLH
jgi:hypothetical protein